MHIRAETDKDLIAIAAVTQAAFLDVELSSQTEAQIINALREAGVLTLSLVAERDQDIIGHIAFSPVLIDGADVGWFGLGPVSVEPSYQGQGVGQALVDAGLAALRTGGAWGCVVLGDPRYYERFGFRADVRLRLAWVPPENFMALLFQGDPVQGDVTYHAGFEAR